MVRPLVPLAVQTAGLVVENVTVNPDDAFAFTVNGDCTTVRGVKALNEIVCPFLTAIDCWTCGAAL